MTLQGSFDAKPPGKASAELRVVSEESRSKAHHESTTLLDNSMAMETATILLTSIPAWKRVLNTSSSALIYGPWSQP